MNFPNYASLKQRILDLATREIEDSRRYVGAMGKKEDDRAEPRAEDWGDYDPEAEDGGDVNAMNKGGKGGKAKGGKGKGDGGQATVFHGDCYNCGETGHSARFCTKPKKDKGGGKGGKGDRKKGDRGKGGDRGKWPGHGGAKKIGALGDDPTNWFIGEDGTVWQKSAPAAAAPVAAAAPAATPGVGQIRLKTIGVITAKPLIVSGAKHFARHDLIDDNDEEFDIESEHFPIVFEQKHHNLQMPRMPRKYSKSRQNILTTY